MGIASMRTQASYSRSKGSCKSAEKESPASIYSSVIRHGGRRFKKPNVPQRSFAEFANIRHCQGQMTSSVNRLSLTEEQEEIARTDYAVSLARATKKDRLKSLRVQQLEWRRQETQKTERHAYHQVKQGEETAEHDEADDAFKEGVDTEDPKMTMRGIDSLRSLLSQKINEGGKSNRLSIMSQLSQSRWESTQNQHHSEKDQEIEHISAVPVDEIDVQLTDEAFWRYDTDSSGELELSELRAVLYDVGILTDAVEERAELRRSLAHVVKRKEDFPESEEDAVEDTQDIDIDAQLSMRLHQMGEEKSFAQRIAVNREQLSDLLAHIRLRLKLCRGKVYRDLFQRYDIFDKGEIDLATVRLILNDEGLTSNREGEEEYFKEVVTWIRDRRAHGLLEMTRTVSKPSNTQNAAKRSTSKAGVRRETLLHNATKFSFDDFVVLMYLWKSFARIVRKGSLKTSVNWLNL
jgi:Ca2+-binding EF-hand superfamily protein